MSAVPETPRAKPSQGAASTPTTTRVAASALTTSPHYTTTRRHSLYGTEDRVVIDPGSRVWKIGFSGEHRPRAVFRVHGQSDSPLWSLHAGRRSGQWEEENLVLFARLQHELRRVFHNILLADPKSRKVIIVEHPLLPIYVKEMLGRILFENLQVPSVSFAPSGLLSLVGVGRLTGLVIDCGHLETTVLPIYSSRPMYTLIQATPIAGLRLNSHLRALLLLFGSYYPPPATLSGAANMPIAPQLTGVPEETLTDKVIEEIKTRCCFVGRPLADSQRMVVEGDTSFETVSQPPSSDPVMSESEGGVDIEPTDPRVSAMYSHYRSHSTATDLQMRVTPPVSQQYGTGLGTLVIPGWIRERAAEMLFEGGDVDERSVIEIVLDCLRKVPIDLRLQMASTIVVTGGTAMLPGFITRLRAQLKAALADPSSGTKQGKHQYDPYSSVRTLASSIAVVNDPAPPVASASNTRQGRAPAFAPALLPWIGGSLSGSLKVAGQETMREMWDEGAGAAAMSHEQTRTNKRMPPKTAILPDWTLSPLPVGAPVVNILRLQPATAVAS